MKKSHLISLFLVSSLLGFFVQSTHAQSLTLPSDLNILCGPLFIPELTANCFLTVPAETIGLRFEAQLPRSIVQSVQNLQVAPPPVGTSVIPLRLDVRRQPNEYLLQIDTFAPGLKALSSRPYALVSFDISVNATSAQSFPFSIPSLLNKVSEFHTESSFTGSNIEISPPDDVPFQITIHSGVQAAPDPPVLPEPDLAPSISAGFSYEPEPEGELRGAAEYCFDDPSFSMTAAEWAIICEAKARGIISGNPRANGTFFFPAQNINRAEAVKVVTLGILRSLGRLSQSDFDTEQARLEQAYQSRRSTILYPDIGYDAPGQPNWFAVYVSLATREQIVGGYPDGSYKPANEINNAESYRVIVETGAVASSEINAQLLNATRLTGGRDWFLKYAQTLRSYDLAFSDTYGDLTTRKDFLILVMRLLKAVGL